jgi:putative SOS response-associated peptidase YedK
MCGRFVLILDPGDFEDEFDLGGIPQSYLPRYNITPTQPVAVVRDPKSRKVEMFRWGLIPFWAKDASIGSRLINARAETLAEKPSFKYALAKRRNLILASGFYEWRPVDPLTNPKSKGKVPLFIHMKDNKPFVFAGLWEEWKSQDGEVIHSTTIITTNSNAMIAPFHERMPVILDNEKMHLWLDPTRKLDEIVSLLQPYPAEVMEYHPVSSVVNSPAYDNPICIKEIAI